MNNYSITEACKTVEFGEIEYCSHFYKLQKISLQQHDSILEVVVVKESLMVVLDLNILV